MKDTQDTLWLDDAPVKSVNIDALEQIHRLLADWGNADGEGLIDVIRLLQGTLDVKRITLAIDYAASADNLWRLSTRQKHELLYLVERWGANRGQVNQIVNSLSDDNPLPGSSTEAAVFSARTRLEHRLSLAQGSVDHVPLISIGAACFAWALPNRWGMRRRADIRRLFNPFCYAYYRAGFIAEMVAEDFATYADKSLLKSTTTARGYPIIARADGRALWNHCVGPYWSADEFRHFRNYAESGLNRFRTEAFESAPFRVFIYHMPNMGADEQAAKDVSDLADALSQRAEGAHALLAIDTNRRDTAETDRREQAQIGVKIIAPSVSIIRAPTPTKNYLLFSAESYNSPEGIEYEKAIVQGIRASVAAWAETQA